MRGVLPKIHCATLVFLFSLPVTFFLHTTPSVPLDKQGRPIWHEGQVRVMYWEPIGLERAEEVARPHGGKLLSHYKKISVFKIPKGLSEKQFADILKKNPRVRFAEPDYCIYPLVYPIPDDFLYQVPNQGEISTQRFDEAWNDADPQLSSWSRGVGDPIVAVLDWGIRETHEDLDEKLWTNPGEIENGVDDDGNGLIDDIHGWNYNTNNNDLSDDPCCSGHGTHVAGVIIAETNNNQGIAGFGWNNLGMILTGNYLASIYYAIDNGASVINMSFSSASGYSPAEEAVINDAWDAGLVLCGAAGNTGIEEYKYPASYDNVISVVMLNSSGGAGTSSTTYNDKVDVGAIGEGVKTMDHQGDSTYASGNGSSMSCPQVSGLAAILMSLGLTNADVKNRIEQTCNDINFAIFPGWDKYFGWGRIDAYQAVASLIPPSSLAATGTSGQIDLTWVAPNRTAYPTDHFKIYRSESPGGPYTNIGQTADGVTLNYSDTTVNPGTTYYYVIKAVDDHGLNTKVSNEDSASATGTPWTATVTSTSTVTPTSTFTKTGTPTSTLTWSATVTPTCTHSVSHSPTFTDSPTPTSSPTWTSTATPTWSKTVTATLTDSTTITPTATSTRTLTSSPTWTSTATPTWSGTVTATLTDSTTITPTATPTWTPSITKTATRTYTMTFTSTPSPYYSPTETRTVTSTYTITPTGILSSTFTITPTPEVTPTPPAADEGDTYCYPQPARAGHDMTIVYGLSKPGKVRVLLYNVEGDKVGEFDGHGEAGDRNQLTFNTRGMAVGVYYYIIEVRYDGGGVERFKPRKFGIVNR